MIDAKQFQSLTKDIEESQMQLKNILIKMKFLVKLCFFVYNKITDTLPEKQLSEITT